MIRAGGKAELGGRGVGGWEVLNSPGMILPDTQTPPPCHKHSPWNRFSPAGIFDHIELGGERPSCKLRRYVSVWLSRKAKQDLTWQNHSGGEFSLPAADRESWLGCSFSSGITGAHPQPWHYSHCSVLTLAASNLVIWSSHPELQVICH